MGGVEEAALRVKVYDGSVRAVIMHQGKVTIYAKEMRYDYLPRSSAVTYETSSIQATS